MSTPVSPASNPASSAHTLQAYLELIFMNTANNLLYNKMAPLSSALTITRNALNDLAGLQNIHNLVSVFSPGSPPPLNATGASAWLVGGASAYYNTPIKILPNFGGNLSPASTYALAYDTINGYPQNILTGSNAFLNNKYFIGNGNYDAYPVSGFATTSEFSETTPIPVGMGSIYVPTSLASAKILASAQAAQVGQALLAKLTGGTYTNTFTSTLNQLLTLKSALSTNLIPALSANSPAAALSSPNSLYSELKTVLANLNSANLTNIETPTFIVTTRTIRLSTFEATPPFGLPVNPLVSTITVYSGYLDYSNTGLGKWLIDGYNTAPGAGSITAGNINNNITGAITAAQSLNTTQSTLVSSYLQTYQTYYQAAASMLTQYNQILTQMAQNITGR